VIQSRFKTLVVTYSLIPFAASLIAFADGVYLDLERDVVEKIKRQVKSTDSVYAYV